MRLSLNKTANLNYESPARVRRYVSGSNRNISDGRGTTLIDLHRDDS